MDKKVIAACYMRYSSHAQDEGNSIEAQEKAIRKYADENNYELQYIYIDKAKTGTNSKRSQFQKMVNDAQNGLFNVCLIHKTDRFARSRVDSVLYKSMLRKNGIDVISVSENFSKNKAERVITEGMAEVVAEYYSVNLANEVRKGLDVIASKGLHTGGTPPLGYDVGEDKKLIINEAEAEIVRLIFDRYANGYTYNAIAKELQAKGYKTKTGNEFSVASFSSILRQRKYIGEYVYNRRVAKDDFGSVNSHKDKPEEEIVRIPNTVPRIIDDRTFKSVQERLALNKRKTVTYRANSSYLLSGLVVCGECGYHYQGNTRSCGHNNNIYSSYRCGKKQNHKIGCGNSEIEKNRLETFVLEQMQRYLFTDEAIRTIVEKVNAYSVSITKNQNADIILYEQELKSVEGQIKNLSNAIAKGVCDDILVEKINTLSATKNDIKHRIESIKPKELPPIVESDVRQALTKFIDYMRENKEVECKAFLNKYIKKIIVYKDKVEVTFKVSSSVFNADYPDDKSGALLINLAISRLDLKRLPKQRRRINKKGVFGDNYLIGYEITT